MQPNHKPTMNNPTQLPAQGLSSAAVFEQLNSFKSKDIPWKSGRVFAYVYEPPAETKQVVGDAYKLYLSENGLDPIAFSSLLNMERQVVSIVANLLQASEGVVGNFTHGGTESIILAVKTARDYFRTHRPEISRPEMILPISAHAAFHKAAHYLGIEMRLIPIDPTTYAVDTEAVRQAINPNTILIVGSAPNYSHGVVDDIPTLAALAKEHGVFCHVDACVGGFYLPFARQLGYEIPPFDFSVEGVTSMSCDLHKYGYTAKGASVILYRTAEIRKYQIFTCSNWTGYTIINPVVVSSKSGGNLAGAWAALHHLGTEGYSGLNRTTQKATRAFIEGVGKMAELEVLGKPVMNLVAVASKHPAVSVFSIADMLGERGWHIQTQLASSVSPATLHLNINPANEPHIAELLADLQAVVEILVAKGEVFEPIDTSFISAALEMEGGFAQLAQNFGIGDGNLPAAFAPLNQIIDLLPVRSRDILFKEFINEILVARG